MVEFSSRDGFPARFDEVVAERPAQGRAGSRSAAAAKAAAALPASASSVSVKCVGGSIEKRPSTASAGAHHTVSSASPPTWRVNCPSGSAARKKYVSKRRV